MSRARWAAPGVCCARRLCTPSLRHLTSSTGLPTPGGPHAPPVALAGDSRGRRPAAGLCALLSGVLAVWQLSAPLTKVGLSMASIGGLLPRDPAAGLAVSSQLSGAVAWAEAPSAAPCASIAGGREPCLLPTVRTRGRPHPWPSKPGSGAPSLLAASTRLCLGTWPSCRPLPG